MARGGLMDGIRRARIRQHEDKDEEDEEEGAEDNEDCCGLDCAVLLQQSGLRHAYVCGIARVCCMQISLGLFLFLVCDGAGRLPGGSSVVGEVDAIRARQSVPDRRGAEGAVVHRGDRSSGRGTARVRLPLPPFVSLSPRCFFLPSTPSSCILSSACVYISQVYLNTSPDVWAGLYPSIKGSPKLAFPRV